MCHNSQQSSLFVICLYLLHLGYGSFAPCGILLHCDSSDQEISYFSLAQICQTFFPKSPCSIYIFLSLKKICSFPLFSSYYKKCPIFFLSFLNDIINARFECVQEENIELGVSMARKMCRKMVKWFLFSI